MFKYFLSNTIIFMISIDVLQQNSIHSKVYKVFLLIIIQAICQSIKPKIMTGDVLKFVIEHINFDLTSVQNILGINRDDAVLFMHHLLVHVMNRRNAGNCYKQIIYLSKLGFYKEILLNRYTYLL